MVQNFTLRVIIGVGVAVAAWFVLLYLLSLGGGLTNLELAVVAVLAFTGCHRQVMGLGRKARSPNQS